MLFLQILHSFYSMFLHDQGNSYKGNIVVRKGSWIGANSIILSGVEIGHNSVVAASSVVTKNIPSHPATAAPAVSSQENPHWRVSLRRASWNESLKLMYLHAQQPEAFLVGNPHVLAECRARAPGRRDTGPHESSSWRRCTPVCVSGHTALASNAVQWRWLARAPERAQVGTAFQSISASCSCFFCCFCCCFDFRC